MEPADVARDVRAAPLKSAGVADGVAARGGVGDETDHAPRQVGVEESRLLEVAVYLRVGTTVRVQHECGVALDPAKGFGGAFDGTRMSQVEVEPRAPDERLERRPGVAV